MTNQEFIKELSKRLNGLSERDKNQVLFYYDDLIFGAMENGVDEEEAVRSVGSLDEIVLKIMTDYNLPYLESKEEESETIEFPKGIGLKTLSLPAKNIDALNIINKASNVVFVKHHESDLKIRHFNIFFSKLSLHKRNNTLYVKEESKRFLGYALAIAISLLISFIITFTTFDLVSRGWRTVVIFLVSIGVCQGLINLLGLFFKVDKMIVFLPDIKPLDLNVSGRFGNYHFNNIDLGNISASLSSGNIKFTDCNAKSVYLKVSSGNIKYINNELEENRKTKDFTALAKSGNIKLYSINSENIRTRCRSGNIYFKKINSIGKIDAENTSGTIKGFSVNCEEIIAKVRSGSVKFSDTAVSKNSSFASTSGSIKMRNFKCSGKIDAESYSGFVTAFNLNAGNIKAKARSGFLRFIESNINDTINLETTAGMIKLKNSAFQHITAQAGSGSVILKNIKGRRKEYKIDAQTKAGHLLVKEYYGNTLIEKEEQITADKTIRAEVKSGVVKILFMPPFIEK